MSYKYNELNEKERERLDADRHRRAELKIYKIQCDLKKMLSYGQQLQKTSDEKAIQKGELLASHALYLNDLLQNRYENGTLKNNFQKNFVTELNKHNALFNKHREVKQIIASIAANIALFLLGGGVFYTLAVGTRFATHGPGFFFTRTKSRDLIARVEERVNYYQAPGYFMSDKELAQREIKTQVAQDMYEQDLREMQTGLFGAFHNFP